MVKITLKWSAFVGYDAYNSNKIPDEKGVYEYFIRLKNGNSKIIYVGQADDVRQRSVDHLLESEKNECLKKNLKEIKWDFRYALLPLEADRQDAEQALYDIHKPECNQVRPSGSGRKIPSEIEETS